MQHVYTIPDGVLQTYTVDDEEGTREVPLDRGGAPPPCEICPKGSPANDSRYRLSDRNLQSLALYERLEATYGAYRLPGFLARCPVFAENMRLVKQAIESGKLTAKLNAMEQKKGDDG